jgi:hypothetical protein
MTHTRRLTRVTLALLSLAGCASTSGPHDGASGTDASATQDAQDASTTMTCTGIGTCPDGYECIAGASGCGFPLTCVPASTVMCVRSIEPYCGCDGVTFQARGGCPDRPFAYRGECLGDAGAADGR